MNAGHKRIVCFGAAVMDRKYYAAARLTYGTSNPVSSTRACGGVARNVAENLARLQVPVCMISVVGDDACGRELSAGLASHGVDVSMMLADARYPSAEYAALLEPDKNLALGMADMDIFEALTVARLQADWPQFLAAAMVFADCNLPQATLHELIRRCRAEQVKLAIDAVSGHKAMRLPASLVGVNALFLNQDEALAYLGAVSAQPPPPELLVMQLVQRGAQNVVMTMGPDGLLLADRSGVRHMQARQARVADVTGAGDALIAGTLYGLQQGATMPEAAAMGTCLAKLTLETDYSVCQDLHPDMLRVAMRSQ